MERAYRITKDQTVATFSGCFYVGGVGRLAFFDTPDGRSFSERRLAAMVAKGEATRVAPDCAAGHELHVEMARAGVSDHAAFASQVLGYPVAHFRYLNRAERNALREALADRVFEGAAAENLLPF